jgi:ribosomal protein L36
MKSVSSLQAAKSRDKNCELVKRTKTRKDGSKKTVLVVINKKNPRFKVRQG